MGWCLAYGQECRLCGKRNHFAAVCYKKRMQKQVRQFDSSDTSSDHPRQRFINHGETEGEGELLWIEHYNGAEQAETIATVVERKEPAEKIFAVLEVSGEKIRFLLDTGATCNVISKAHLPRGTFIKPTGTTLKLYGATKLEPVGQFKAEIRNPKTGQTCRTTFIVVPSPVAIPLLGAPTVQEMHLVKVQYENICMTNLPSCSSTEHRLGGNKTEVMAQFPTVFDGELGTMQGDIHLETDNTI